MIASQTIPLLRYHAPEAVFARQHGKIISTGRFVAEATALAERLPAQPYLLNLCADRYHFAVGVAAALLRGQISLLPPNQTPDLLERLGQRYPGAYCLSDGADVFASLHTVRYPELSGAGLPPLAMPEIPAQQMTAILFTSGSTGEPVPHAKSWGDFAYAIHSGTERLGIFGRSDLTLLGTVPPQHMFGFETTVLYAMQGGMILHAAKPFFPADIAVALNSIPGAKALVTTPVHLRALLGSGITLPALELMICATAPLPRDLAIQAEAIFGAPLYEIYGSTETGQIASRRTSKTEEWRTLDGISLRQQDETTYVSGGHVAAELVLNDVIELHSETTFLLHGRTSDLINIAGKRTSLASLNHHLNQIEGVLDGVFFMPDETANVTARLTAFVVASGLDAAAILTALRQRIDPVFLPRPLLKVDALPRNATGKLTHASLELLLQQAKRSGT